MGNIRNVAASVILSFVFLAIFATASLISAPRVASAQNTNYKGLVQCDGFVTDAATQKKCDFDAFIGQINYLINWAFFIAIPIASGLLAYAGYYYMFTGEAGHAKAKKIFESVGYGLVFMLIGWFVVHTILVELTKPGMGFGSLIGS